MKIITDSQFKEVYNIHYEPVCRYLNYYTQDAFAIEEVVQETFVKLWEDRESFDIEHMRTYLYRSAGNRMLNYLKSQRKHIVLAEEWAKREIDRQNSKDCIDMVEFLTLLTAAVDMLPEKCKEIYQLSRDQRLSYKEIAELKKISVKTVEAQMGIALKRIRDYVLMHYDKDSRPLILSLLLLFY